MPEDRSLADEVILDAPSDAVHQGHEIEIDTQGMPADEVMPKSYDPGKTYAVDPDVSHDGITTSS